MSAAIPSGCPFHHKAKAVIKEREQELVPMGCVAHLGPQWHRLANDLKELLTCNPDYDDGNYGPVFIRLAWHASGSWNPKTGQGGSNGATMRFAPESERGANAGLDIPRQLLDEFRVSKGYTWCSVADLWILASYVFIETSDGPVIDFMPGRVDKTSADVPPDGTLPDGEQGFLGDDLISNMEQEKKANIDHIRKIFGKDGFGFSDQEMTCLIVGGHAYGRCHPNRSGFAGKWVSNPVKWGGEEFCRSLQNSKMWRVVDGKCPIKSVDKVTGVCPVLGNKQFVDKKNMKMMLMSDMALVWDPVFKEYIDMYADDDDLLKKDFGRVFKKLTEFGCGPTSRL
jgi:catalase (peroxidase I)